MMRESVAVLLVEDDEDDYILARDLLSESTRTQFNLNWVSTYEEAVSHLRRDAHDVYLIDYRLGDHDGLELLRKARELGCAKPMIVLTGMGTGDIDIEAMRAGAADYLVKGQLDTQVLERSIRYALEQNRTLRALRESEQRYALSARGANDGLWVWDLRGDEVYYSARWKAMLGYDEEEIGTTPDEWFGRVHPDDLALLATEIEVHRQGMSESISNEHRMRRKNGSYRWMLARAVAERAPDGTALRLAGSQTDVTERRLAIERLTHDAFHDPLTQLANRALFMDRLGQAVRATQRYPEKHFAVLFLDLDRFKIVNDSLGHAIGDELLKAAGHRLEQILRSSDTVARIGGDEFTILLDPVEHIADALRTVERLHEELRVPFTIGNHEIFTSASVGVALSMSGYERPDDILRDADIAMYRAKANGKARHEVFDKTMHDQAVRQMAFETELRRAIDRDELRVHYQPIVTLPDAEIAGFEALVRWQHGDELVTADEIIPVAEETGLILQIGRWVLRAALEQLREWDALDPRFHSMHMNVNVSARQFLQPNLTREVVALLDELQIAPHRLHLEVTESVVIANEEQAAAILTELRSAGVKTSLDDFGTGYSSLGSLQHFPFDVLKIDRSFVADEENSERSDAILRTVSSLARTLGMRVTVEGLETFEQADRIKALPLDFAQGFFFARPMAADAAVALVTGGRQWKNW
jgi:diguanylate cyclase (GGDEF)-like protein/PAS domain S-box-containing protein